MLSKEQIQNEFQLDPSLIYLNHAAVAPWPTRTQQAVIEFANENALLGATHYPEWLKVEQKLKLKLKTLINAPSVDDIALLKNTSEALSFVAGGLDWSPGDNIVISNQEFPSNRIVWQQLKSRGVEVREVDLTAHSSPEQALIDAFDKNTRLFSISSVQYASGLRVNLNQLGEACRKRQILFCVDAIQSIGALKFDVQSIQADFVMADTHKWMLGPEGVALFYCREEIRNQLKLTEYGWHMVENMHDFTREKWLAAKSARRFECGSPNMLGIHAANASVSLLLDVGINVIEEAVLERTQYALECIEKAANLELISLSSPKHLSGIVTFRSHKVESEQLYNALMKKKIICANRGGGVRFSPHFYTDKDLINKAVQLSNLFD